MKKTSIFFLIVSVILIITGFVMRNNALKKAEAADIDLFTQTITENGDLLETVVFSSEDINKINISVSSGDINIIGNAEKSYVEIINYNALEYSTYSNNRAFNIQDDLVSSLIGRAEGGDIKFNGVRDYIRFEKYNSDKKINVYIASTAAVKVFDIKLGNGNVKIDNANLVCDYMISIDKGDVICSDTEEISLLDAKLKKGNVKLDNIYIANTKLNIENGDLEFSTPSYIIYDYNIENETGEISYNGEKHAGTYITDTEGTNGNFRAHIGVGNVILTTTEENSNKGE